MQKSHVCPRCTGAFTLKDGRQQHKRPLLLHCGHTFCESCLTHLVRDKHTSIVCPTCKVETSVPSGENGVRLMCTDRFMMGSVMHVQRAMFDMEIKKLEEVSEKVTIKRKQSENQCKECNKRLAASYCPKCDCNMCAACFSMVHKLSKSLQMHVPIPLGEEGYVEVSQMCKIHENRPLEYYCEDDGAIICSRCVIVGDHKGHNISSIEDKNRTIVVEMEPNLQVANYVHRRLKKIDKELQDLVPDYKREMLPALLDIRAHFQQLHGLLQVREAVLEQAVLDVAKAGLEPIEQLKKDLTCQRKQLDQTIKSAQRILNNNDEVIVNAREILEKLVQARDIPCIIEKSDVTGDQYEKIIFTPDPTAETILQNYGKVSGKLPQRYVMHTYREMPELFSEDCESLVSTPLTTPLTTPSSTPLDSVSVASDSTSQSEDILIEEEQEVMLEVDEHGERVEKPGKVKKHKKADHGNHDKPAKAKKFKGQHEDVLVTHITNPHSFVVQLKRDQSKLATLSYSIQRWCNSAASKEHMVSAVDEGDYVLAQFSVDKQWYRARIKHVMDQSDDDFSKINVEVLYFDFGNSEVVPIPRLREMQMKFMKQPEFSIDCSLFNLVPKDKEGTWSKEAVYEFGKMVEDKTMVLTVVQEENNIMKVDLSKPGADEDIADDRPVSVRDALVFMGVARMESNKSLPQPGSSTAPKRNYITPSPKDEGCMYPVLVSYAGSPDCFYIHELGEECNYLATLMAQIQDTYSKGTKDSWQVICPQIGMICVAQYSRDGMWYRARIIDLPGNRQVTVRYVDYGNTETVHLLNIRKIIDSFLILPAQAECCRLQDVEACNDNEGWTTECLELWTGMVDMRRFVLKVITDGQQLGVVLREPDSEDMYHTVNIRMVESGLARSTGSWSEPQHMDSVVSEMSEVVPRLSYRVGSGSFPEPCDLGHQPVYWKSRNTKPTRRYEETVLTPPDSPTEPEAPGSFPVVRKGSRPSQRSAGGRHGNKGRDEPARAKSSEDMSEGNIDVTEYKTPSPLSSGSATPTQRSPTKTPKATTVEHTPVETQTVSTTLNMSVQSEPSRQSSVSSTKSHHRSAEKAEKVDKSARKSEDHRKKSHKSHSKSPKDGEKDKPTQQVIMTHFVSPSEFYLQVEEAGKSGLDQLMLELCHDYQHTEYQWDHWKKGKYCVVYSPNQAKWYRAKIVKVINKNLIEVFSLDYGFTEILSVTNLRSILHQFRKHRVFAFCCKLAGLTPAGGMKEWSRTACEEMQNLLVNKKLYITVRGKSDGTALPVDLIMEEYIDETALEPGRRVFTSIIEQMKEKGLAIPLNKKRQEEESVSECQMFPVLYYKKAEAEVKTGDSVMPVYVDYDAIIHCYTMTGDDQFQAMCDSLQQKFKYSEAPQGDQKWEKGQGCAGYYVKDATWHRARIMETQPDQVQIHFIDYGNTEWVGYDLLRADIEEFTEIPQQTFLCTLHDIRPVTEEGNWEIPVLEKVHKDLVNQYCNITVVERNGYANEHMTVHLELRGKDYGTTLVQYGLAQRGDYITDDEMRSARIEDVLLNNNPFKTSSSLSTKELSQCLVTHIELPNVVYLQNLRLKVGPDMDTAQQQRVNDNNDLLTSLEKLSLDINMRAPTLSVIAHPNPGMACCARYDVDQRWYRAVVIEHYTETKEALVVFVDYGNCEILPDNQLRSLPIAYHHLPCQSVRCRLAYIIPPNNIQSWTKNALWGMTEAVLLQNVAARVMSEDPLSVDLYIPGSEDALIYQSVMDSGLVVYDSSGVPSPVAEKPGPGLTTNTSNSVNTETGQEHRSPCKQKTSPSKIEKQKVKNNVAMSNIVNMDSKPVSESLVEVVKEEVLDISTTTDDASMASSVDTRTGENTTPSKSWAEMAEESCESLESLPELDADSESDHGRVNQKTSEKGDEIGVDTGVEGGKKNSLNVSPDYRGDTSNSYGSGEDCGKFVGSTGGIVGGALRGTRGGKMSAEEKQRLREERRKNRSEALVATAENDDECFD